MNDRLDVYMATETFCLFVAMVIVLAFPFRFIWNFAVVEAVAVAKPISYSAAACLVLLLIAFRGGK